MTNIYFIQLIGVLITVAGMFALALSARLFERRLTHAERPKMGEKRSNVYQLPINLETFASAALFLS